MNVHQSGILSTLLLTVVHLIEGRALTVELVIVQSGCNTGDDWKCFRIFERDPQRTLPAHADAFDRNGAEMNIPPLLKERNDIASHELFRSHRWIEFFTDWLSPPRVLTVRASAGEIQFIQKISEDVVVAQRLQTIRMKMQETETSRIDGIVYLDGFALHFQIGPCAFHAVSIVDQSLSASGVLLTRLYRT